MMESVPTAQGCTAMMGACPAQHLCGIYGYLWGCPLALLSPVLALAQSPHCRQSSVSHSSPGSTALQCCWCLSVAPLERHAQSCKVQRKQPQILYACSVSQV